MVDCNNHSVTPFWHWELLVHLLNQLLQFLHLQHERLTMLARSEDESKLKLIRGKKKKRRRVLHSWQWRRSVHQWSWAATPAVLYIWAFWPSAILSSITRCVFSLSLPASVSAWPNALSLYCEHPDVILDSWVQQVNYKWTKGGKKSIIFLDLSCCVLWK